MRGGAGGKVQFPGVPLKKHQARLGSGPLLLDPVVVVFCTGLRKSPGYPSVKRLPSGSGESFGPLSLLLDGRHISNNYPSLRAFWWTLFPAD